MKLHKESVILFRTGVERVLTNWTALKLAVEHGMGGPNSRKLAEDFVLYVGDMLIESGSMEPQDVADMLIEVMDTQFQTWCEDDSPNEISRLLCSLFELAKAMNTNELKDVVHSLPLCESMCIRQLVPEGSSQDMEEGCATATISETAVAEDMTVEDLDLGWIQVKTRRKR